MTVHDVARGLKDKRLKALARTAVRAGWVVEVTAGQHVRWLAPDKAISPIITALTGGGRSDYERVRKALRRAGIEV